MIIELMFVLTELLLDIKLTILDFLDLKDIITYRHVDSEILHEFTLKELFDKYTKIIHFGVVTCTITRSGLLHSRLNSNGDLLPAIKSSSTKIYFRYGKPWNKFAKPHAEHGFITPNSYYPYFSHRVWYDDSNRIIRYAFWKHMGCKTLNELYLYKYVSCGNSKVKDLHDWIKQDPVNHINFSVDYFKYPKNCYVILKKRRRRNNKFIIQYSKRI